MTKLRSTLIAIPLLTLAACGGTPEATPEAAADDFAARINSGGDGADAPQTEPTPSQVAAPLPNAAEGAFVPGTATDPQSSTCGANQMGQFLGRLADDATRNAIMQVAPATSNVRFILPGSDYVNPDPTSPRLNLMLDAANVIRDARCG